MAEKVTIVTEMVDKVTGTAKMIEKTITKFNKKITTQARSFDISAGGQKRLAKTTKSLKDISEQYAAKQLKVSESAAALANKNKLLVDWSEKTGMSVNRLSKGIQMQGYRWNEQGKLVDQAGRNVKNIGKVMNDSRAATRRFKMEYLGLLFAGMAIKRVFDGIRRSTVTAFTKIMESSDMLGTNVQRLGVHWEYLKFTIGSAIDTALTPLMPVIIEILSSITDWIQQNPKLTAGIIILGGAIGTFLMVFGQLALFIGSITTVLTNFGVGVGELSFSFLGLFKWILIIIAGLLILNGVLGDPIGFDNWAANAQKNTGIVGKLLLGVARTFNNAGLLLGNSLQFILAGFTGWVKILVGQALSALSNEINRIISMLNFLIRGINKIPGINISLIPKVDFGGSSLRSEGFSDIAKATSKANIFQGIANPIETFTGVAGGSGSANITIEQNNNYNGIGDLDKLKEVVDSSLAEATNISKSYL